MSCTAIRFRVYVHRRRAVCRCLVLALPLLCAYAQGLYTLQVYRQETDTPKRQLTVIVREESFTRDVPQMSTCVFMPVSSM